MKKIITKRVLDLIRSKNGLNEYSNLQVLCAKCNRSKRNKDKTIQPEISVDSKWANLVDKAMRDYNSLTKNERIWFNLRVLIDSFNDGGLISYYYNSGAENVYETIEDLGILKLDKLATIIKKYNEILFPKLVLLNVAGVFHEPVPIL